MLNVKSTDTLIEVCEAEQQQQGVVECVLHPAFTAIAARWAEHKEQFINLRGPKWKTGDINRYLNQ